MARILRLLALSWPLWLPMPVATAGACLIKGNINRHGERIYHVPGSRWHARTKISPGKGERWFCSEEEAIAAGWRPPLDQPLSPAAQALLGQGRGRDMMLMQGGMRALRPTPVARRYRARRALKGGRTSPSSGCRIKGNINRRGECIYHVPGSRWYERTKISPGKGERWFCSEEEAIAAGCRAPRR